MTSNRNQKSSLLESSQGKGGSELLCNTCAQLDLAAFLGNEQWPTQPPPGEPLLWDIESLRTERCCPLCQLLLQTLELTRSFQSLSTGIVCAKCDAFAWEFEPTHPNTAKGRGQRLWIYACRARIPPSDPDGLVELNGQYNQCLYLESETPYQEEDKCLFKARRIQDTVDLALVSSWLSTCEEHHTFGCQPESPPTGLFDFRVIDVESGCVTDAPLACKYIALSYVWGGVDQLQLTSVTQKELQQKGGLFRSWQQMPNSIRDAVTLCQKMKETYLWVDTLCILQDDTADKDAQIANMHNIYMCAKMTIVAAAGSDAHAGLPALCGSRLVSQYSENVFGVNLITSPRYLLASLDLSTWITRAWTLQEHVLSKRLLVFTESLVFFQCQQCTWREDIVLESGQSQVELNEETSSNNQYPTPWMAGENSTFTYEALVQTLMKRQISRDEDILRAFTGIMECLRPGIGQCLSGLPEKYFGRALCWHADVPFPITRRCGFPSWSWAGWKFAETKEVHFQGWGTGSTDSSVTFCRVVTQEEVKCFVGGEMDIERLPEELYSHITGPSEARIDGLLHLTDINSKTAVSEIIWFWTSAAMLHVDFETHYCPCNRPLSDYRAEPDTSRDYPYAVRGNDGNHIGDVLLDSDWRSQKPQQLEFILIAFYFETSRDILPMLIEWNDGIAYRVQMMRELAPIKQDVWMSAKPQRKLIVLG
jgi:hypothetical protein